MEHAVSFPLTNWEAFYVIVGTSAAALTGLQFVMIVLGVELGMVANDTTRAFGTPTVVHFCAVLLISAIQSAPWPGLAGPAIGLGACGVAGAVYAAIIVQRARRQNTYVLVLEDWLFHWVFPLVAYVALLVSAFLLFANPEPSLFVIGAAALVLLFVGIHNAWDAVIYVALRNQRPS